MINVSLKIKMTPISLTSAILVSQDTRYNWNIVFGCHSVCTVKYQFSCFVLLSLLFVDQSPMRATVTVCIVSSFDPNFKFVTLIHALSRLHLIYLCFLIIALRIIFHR